MARVSILLPAFNAARTLGAALRSVQRQTFTDWRCVVVDDGSHDDTYARAAAVAAVDARFTVLPLPHRGLVSALNAGLHHCDGQYIARMDADDLMHRHRLAAQVDCLDHCRELAAVGCHIRIFPRAGLGEGWRTYERWVNHIESPDVVRAEAFIESPVVHPTLMFRRQALLDLRYRDCGWPEDYDLILRLLAAGGEVGVIPRRLLAWRDSPSRATRSDARCAIDRFIACKAAALASGFLSAGDGYALWGFGSTGRAMRGALRSHGKRLEFVVDVHPGRCGNRIDGAPVIRPEELRSQAQVPLLVSVARPHARAEIRAFLRQEGLTELRDFLCSA